MALTNLRDCQSSPETTFRVPTFALQPNDRTYIKETWLPKESRVIYAYTRLYPNLGCHSSQRGESYHVVVEQVTNGQLTLEESCCRLVGKVLDILKELSMDEDRAQAVKSTLLDKHAFRHLIGNISLYALKYIDASGKDLLSSLLMSL